MRVVGVLREAGRDGARRSGAANHHAGVVDRLAPGVAGLDARAAVAHGSGERGLQRVIGGVRIGDDDVLHTEAADHVACAVELRVRRKAGARARVRHWESCSAASCSLAVPT